MLGLGDWLSSKLLILNLISLLLVAAVMFSSRATTKPVKEYFHWMAGVAAVPTGLSIVSTALIIGLLLAVIIVTLIIWIVIITLVIVALAVAASSSNDSKK